MEQRPRIKLQLSPIDWAYRVLGWLSLVAIWCIAIAALSTLPHIIPMHYNLAGKPDGFGSKMFIWFLPIVATFLFVGIEVLSRFPHVFNYPTKITPANAQLQYASATRLLRYLNLVIAIFWVLIEYEIVQGAYGKSGGLGIWYLPLLILLVFIPLIRFIVKSFRAK